MAENLMQGPAASARIGRYRTAERALWERYGARPSERLIELRSHVVQLRVLESGVGPPLLFVHGSGPPGAASVWAPLISGLAGFRCVMLDLPGDGLSSAIEQPGRDYPARIADLLAAVLDALRISRTHVVSWSIGGIWALRMAQRHPHRVDRMVQLAFSPIWTDIRPPAMIRVQATPLGRLMARMPVSPRVVRSLLRNVVGHGASLDRGRISDEMIDWIVALMRETDTARNDLRWLPSLIGWRGGRAGLGFQAAEIAAIAKPLLYVYGTADWPGSREIAERTTSLLPSSRISTVQLGGHVPWLDDPPGVADDVRRFLELT